MDHLKRLVQEAHRRSLWQVLGIYLVSGYVVYEAVQSLTEGLGLPSWFPALAIVLLLIGLPVVLATAFVQEGTPLGRGEDAPDAERARPVERRPEASIAAGGTAEAAAATVEAEATPTASSPTGLLRLFTWRNAIMGGLAAGALWGVVATFWLVTGVGPVTGQDDAPGNEAVSGPGDGRTEPPAVAVLPFANMSPDADFAFFADGVHEDILTNLSKVHGLIVLSRTSVLQYRDTEKPIKEIGDELGASAILEGSVRRFGNQVRITTQLIDADSDAHLWADTYDRTLDDIFAVQTEIAREVTDALNATLTPEEARRIASVPTDDLSAYDLYLEGREAYNRYQQDGNETAIRLFKEAIAEDPEYALAWAGLGDAYAQYVDRWGGASEWADSAVAASRRATELDPESSEAFKALGLALWMKREDDASIVAHERAIELNPNNSGAINNLGALYGDQGHYDRAIPLYAKSERLDAQRSFQTTNLSLAYGFLALWDEAIAIAREDAQARGDTPDNLLPRIHYHYARGEADSVLAMGRRRMALQPSNAGLILHTAGLYLWAGEAEAAESLARDAQRIHPDRPLLADWRPAPMALALAASMRGDSARATALLESTAGALETLIEDGTAPRSGQAEYKLSVINGLLGRTDEAIRWLDAAARDGFFPTWTLDQEVGFDALRGDPRFEEIVDRQRADEARQREAVRAANIVRRVPTT